MSKELLVVEVEDIVAHLNENPEDIPNIMRQVCPSIRSVLREDYTIKKVGGVDNVIIEIPIPVNSFSKHCKDFDSYKKCGILSGEAHCNRDDIVEAVGKAAVLLAEMMFGEA